MTSAAPTTSTATIIENTESPWQQQHQVVFALLCDGYMVLVDFNVTTGEAAALLHNLVLNLDNK